MGLKIFRIFQLGFKSSEVIQQLKSFALLLIIKL